MKLRNVATVAVCLTVTLGAAACGGGDDNANATADSDGVTTLASESPAESLVTNAGTTVIADTDVTEAVDCDAEVQAGIDANTFLRSTKVELSDTAGSPEHTMALVDGVLTPSEITVTAGTPFSFAQATGGIDGIIIGCADGVTSMDGITTNFVISAPGIYTVRLDIAGTDIGVITVE